MNQEPLQPKWVERIFMELHGRFGNVFFDKFRIGELNANGKDIGVENAKLTWGKRLAGLSAERIGAAINANYDYAPSCDDFRAKCVIKSEIINYKMLPKHFSEDEIKHNQERLEEIGKDLSTKSKTDYRAWIRPILANPKNYPDISLKLAKEVEAMSG
jgi:hypothetical protein